MDSLTDLIKSEIKRQYKTRFNFAKASGIPYSTLSNALTNGLEGTSYGTVVRICKMLNIKQTYENDSVLYEDLVLFSKDFRDIYTMLTALDDRGLHTVTTVLKVEHERCLETGQGIHIEGMEQRGAAGHGPRTGNCHLDDNPEVRLETFRTFVRVGEKNEDHR